MRLQRIKVHKSKKTIIGGKKTIIGIIGGRGNLWLRFEKDKLS